jgi:hypothetical protein
MVGGEPRRVAAELAKKFEVVRGVLTEQLSLTQGAKRLRMRPAELKILVEGARRSVLDALAIPEEIADGDNVTYGAPYYSTGYAGARRARP